MTQDHKEREALLPCPHCGASEPTLTYEESNYPGDIRIVCNYNRAGCGASAGFGEGREKARTAWNSRATLQAAPAEREIDPSILATLSDTDREALQLKPEDRESFLIRRIAEWLDEYGDLAEDRASAALSCIRSWGFEIVYAGALLHEGVARRVLLR